MAVLDRTAYLADIENLTGDRADDATLQIIADLTETFDALSDGTNADIDALNAKHAEELEEKDAEWRAKIKDMFFHGDPEKEEETKEETEEPEEKTTYEELFEEKEGE